MSVYDFEELFYFPILLEVSLSLGNALASRLKLQVIGPDMVNWLSFSIVLHFECSRFIQPHPPSIHVTYILKKLSLFNLV